MWTSLAFRKPYLGGCRRLASALSNVQSKPPQMDDIVNLCKRKGFLFPSGEIYGSISGFFDYGPLGVELKNNIKRLWWKDIVLKREDIVGLDSSIIGPSPMWKASGHVDGFSDPMVDCKVTKLRYRADQVFWGCLKTMEGNAVCYVTVLESDNMNDEATKAALKIAKKLGIAGPFQPLSLQDLTQASSDIYHLIPSPATGEPGNLTTPRDFNLMFQTQVGAMADASSLAYLRPETAQGIFANFQNVQRTMRLKVPFGIAQIGKAFRNEITPRNYIFRSREFEQMELEYFIPTDEESWKKFHEQWLEYFWAWLIKIGLRSELLGRQVHGPGKLAHYAKACTDVTFHYPFGWQELMGVAARGDYDLQQHSTHSGKKLEYQDDILKERYIPHVIEPSLGIDRLVLAILTSAYRVEEVPDTQESRVVLSLHPALAPYKAAIFPLVSNKKEIVDVAKSLFVDLLEDFPCEFDTSGAIGRRYRRADEAGTPFCITVDYDSLNDKCVTIRHRDSMKQERIPINGISQFLKQHIRDP